MIFAICIPVDKVLTELLPGLERQVMYGRVGHAIRYSIPIGNIPYGFENKLLKPCTESLVLKVHGAYDCSLYLKTTDLIGISLEPRENAFFQTSLPEHFSRKDLYMLSLPFLCNLVFHQITTTYFWTAINTPKKRRNWAPLTFNPLVPFIGSLKATHVPFGVIVSSTHWRLPPKIKVWGIFFSTAWGPDVKMRKNQVGTDGCVMGYITGPSSRGAVLKP